MGLIASGRVLEAIRRWAGQLAVNAVARDALTALLEVEDGLAQSVKPLENLIRSDPEVIAAASWLNKVAKSLGVSYGEAVRLVASIYAVDAASDDIILLLKPKEGLFDVDRLNAAIAKGEVELRELARLNTFIACPRRGTLPLVAGVLATSHNTPARLLTLANKLGKRTRQKGLFGTDRAYIRVIELERHCDPSLILMPEKAKVIVYGDWLNGLATVIKALVSGRARQIIFYDFQ